MSELNPKKIAAAIQTSLGVTKTLIEAFRKAGGQVDLKVYDADGTAETIEACSGKFDATFSRTEAIRP